MWKRLGLMRLTRSQLVPMLFWTRQLVKAKLYPYLISFLEYQTVDEDSDLIGYLSKAIASSMKILKPNVTSNAQIQGAYSTEASNATFLVVRTTTQGTDNMISLYEFLFTAAANSTSAITSDSDLNLFSYVNLNMNRQTMQSGMDLTQITSDASNGVDCSSVSSFFVCLTYSQCSTRDFVSQGKCEDK